MPSKPRGTRHDAALAQDAKAKQERDAMPKGVSGVLKTMLMHGLFAQFFYWWKDRQRTK